MKNRRSPHFDGMRGMKKVLQYFFNKLCSQFCAVCMVCEQEAGLSFEREQVKISRVGRSEKIEMISTLIKLTYKEDGEKFFGPGIAELLEKIGEKGSVKEACAAMDLSYSKGRGIIARAERCLGYPLVVKHRGGPSGGKSELTADADELLKQYRRLEKEISDFAAEHFKAMTERS